ncbi:YPDG domain-containing protein [Corynebacterium pilbarense]
MEKRNIVRRRGTSVAAAALSIALVAPLAQPIAVPGAAAAAFAAEADADNAAPDNNAGALENDWLQQNNDNLEGEFKPGENETGWRHVYWANGGEKGVTQPKPVEGKPGVYNIDAIAQQQITNGIHLSNVAGQGKDVVSGRASIVTPRGGGQLTTTYQGFKPVPSTVPVYFQWIDSDGARSPIYQTHTHDLEGPSAGKGMYAFAVPEWVDASGKKHRFKAGMGQRYRVWADATPHDYGDEGNPGAPEGAYDNGTQNELVPVRTTGAGFPGAFGIASGSALGEFPAAINVNGNMQRTGVWFYERPYEPGKPENNYMKAEGDAVTLTEDMADASAEIGSKLIEDPFGPIKYAGAHRDPLWKRTVSGKIWHETGNNNQLFNVGDSVGDAPATGAQGYKVFASALTPEGAASYDTEVDSLDPWNRAEKAKEWMKAHPEFLAGTVSGAPNEKGEYTLRFPESLFPGKDQAYAKGTPDGFQRHLYVWVEDPEGRVVAAPTNYSQPEFMVVDRNSQWNPTGTPKPLNSFGYSRIFNMNMALVKDPDLELNITNYNNTNNPAKRGNTAQVVIDGKDQLPVGAQLEWRDGNGKVLKSCTIASKNDLRDKNDPSKDCSTFDVPKDATHGSYYYAALTNGSRDISVDSFVVLVDTPVWDDFTADPNKQDPVTLENIGKKDPQDFPSNPVYQVLDKDGNTIAEGPLTGDDPVGVSIDPDTGDLTFDPKEQSTEPGEKYTVKVYDEIYKTDPDTGDVVTDEEGKPVVEEKRFIDDATISYLAVADDYDPSYDEYVYALGRGETATGKGEIRATFTDVTDTDNPVTVAREDMDPKLGAMGDGKEQSKAFEFAPLPEGWNLVAKAGDVKNPGDISIDSWATLRNSHKKDRGQITFIPPQGAKAGDEYELPVKVTYADGTEDSTTAKITIVGKVADLYDVDYGEAVASAGGRPVTLDPIVTRNTGVPASAPEGTKYELDPDFKVPAGYGIEVDPDTGVITVTPPENATDATEKDFEVPVLVNYPDQTINGTKVTGGQDKATGRVLLDSDGNGVPDIRDVVVTPQDQEVDEGDEITPIEVTPGDPEAEITFNPESGNKLPDGLKFEDGKIVGTPVVENWEPGETERIIPIEVQVTNPDGSTATETAVVRVQKDPSQHKVRVHVVPELTVPVGKPITEIPVRATEANDAEKLAEDATIEVFWFDENGDPIADSDNGVNGLSFDEEKSAIVGTPEKADQNYRIVVRASRDGQTDETYLRLRTVENTDPALMPGTVTDKVPADGTPKVLDDTVQNVTDGLTGEVRDKDGNVIDDAKVEIGTDGKITVTVPEGTDPQDATVAIKDADGNQVGEPIDIEITEPAPSIDNGEGKVEVLEPGAEEPTKLDDKVTNPTEGMTGEVLDNDGNPITGAEVTVDPETGEITVKVPEDAPTGPATVVIKDADGNQVDDPIHVVIAEPTADPTTVDDSNVTEVQPTDDEQSTGIKVDNLDGDTRVQAKDEDGKVIPVIVDEDGNVSVVPGTDVDGPITVTVTDPDLPGGKTEIEVPVAGHTKDKGDNGSDRTVVPGTKVEEIEQGGEDTLDDKVKNPTDGMTGEVRDKDGNPIDGAKVTVDPETGEITVTVPEDAPTGPATVVVKDKDGNDVGGPIHIVVTEKPAEETEGPVVVPVVTTVDDSEVSPVDPTDDEQLTGIVVKNPSEDTKVTAVDEDGKEIPVRIDNNGNVRVTPGEDVDGPITVTITDDNLPNGAVDVEVPVNGHEKGVDDNGVSVEVDKGGIKTVEPNGEEQETGIKVKNPSEDTKVTAVDEDGNPVEVRIDDNGNVVVKPQPGVDGPIKVTITDPSLPNGSVEFEVPVAGHEKNRDDNGSDKPVDDNGTTVDASGKNSVKPTDEKQDSGIKVNNPSEDTEVTATDEDGKDIPAEIDGDGNIHLTPGTDVDGPITVTVTDPNLPNGAVEVEVPVDGHSKNVDDNAISVDKDGVQPVNPTDEKQDSGIKVNNPSEDTEVTATDEDGKDIPAEIDEDGNIHLTPGEDVDGPITVTVTDPNLPNGAVEVEVPVDGHEKNRDDNDSDTASVSTPDVPADGNFHVVGRVNNPDKDGGYTGKLVDRSGKEIEGGVVEIDPETGEIKVSVPAGTDPREAFVAVRDKDGKRVTDKDGYDLRVNIVAPNYGDATAVKPGEKGTSKDPFAGQDLTARVTGAEVEGSEGADNWSFTIDGTSGVITGQAPTNEQLQDSFTEKFPNGKTTWDDFVKQFEGIANPKATGTITLDGVKDPLTGEAKFELVGQDGRSILDPNGDFDGDGVSNRDEIEGKSNPLDVNSTPSEGQDVPEKPAPKPEKPGLTDDERKRCIATSVGFGLPLLALIPIGLATQTAIPGLSPVVEQYSEQIRLANARIQQELGVFNPEIALQVEVINKQLRQFGLDVATVGAGLALIAAGILTGTVIYDNCTPGGIGSSVKDLELKGSSGKTYAGSSEKK